VPSQGSAFTRLRRALDHESLLNADAAAREMLRVGLSEALELLVLIHAHDRTRFSRAAVRWHSRFECELDVTIEESQAVLAALAAMTGPAWRSAASALAELVGGRRELRQGCEALVRRGTS
jgi:hypothetical protein